MGTHSDHDHNHANIKSINTAFIIGIGLNAIYTVIEFVIGYATNSLALIADASHNLSDVAGLIISLIGMKLAQKAATIAYTYGYKKASILASLINSALIVYIVVNIVVEGIQRLGTPPDLQGSIVIFTASIGVLINAVSAYLFYKSQSKDINIKGAFLHLMVDALVSVGVVISGVVLHFTGWNIIDPLISFVIAIVIIYTTWGLMKESFKLTLDGVPKDISVDKAIDLMMSHKCIIGIHHIHVWALSSSENALTAHIELKKSDYSIKEIMRIRKEIKKLLLNNNIQHATLEFEVDEKFCSM